ncbi:YopX family protein [Latilactobacillus sakei]|uniref:YopX family protein n=1 Tax=Latilactobacillus sakei TaxID=1599 RepID=UPI003B9C60F9
MREIRFRAYIKDEGRLLNVNLIDFDDEYVRVWDEYGENEEECFLKDCELMQYTGLKDGNDTEIYEGDIVIRIDDSSDKVSLVKYMDSGARFTANRVSMYQPDERRNYQIIGNKFQNPELLEGAE